MKWNPFFSIIVMFSPNILIANGHGIKAKDSIISVVVYVEKSKTRLKLTREVYYPESTDEDFRSKSKTDWRIEFLNRKGKVLDFSYLKLEEIEGPPLSDSANSPSKIQKKVLTGESRTYPYRWAFFNVLNLTEGYQVRLLYKGKPHVSALVKDAL